MPIAFGALVAGSATYTVTGLTWAPDNNPYASSSAYTATVVLTSAPGYAFPVGGIALPTANGGGTVSAGTTAGGTSSGNTLTFTVLFPPTLAAPTIASVANLMENGTTPLGTYNDGYFTSDTAPNTPYTISGILVDQNGYTITNGTGEVLTILPAPLANGTISSKIVNPNGTFSFTYTSGVHGASGTANDQFSIAVNSNPSISFWTNSY